MLYLLSELSDIFGPFRLFEYITFRAAGAAFTSFLIVVLLGNFTARKLTALNAQAANRYEGILPPEMIYKEKEKTPSMGGILLIGGVLISAVLWMNFYRAISLIFIISTFEFSLLGFYDDYCKIVLKKPKGVSGRFKLITQTIIAFLTVITLCIIPDTHDLMTNINIPFLKEPMYLGYWITGPLGILAIVGASNAVNLTDGKDGLATGCMIFSMLAYGVLAYLMGHKIFSNYLNLPTIPSIGESLVFAGALVGGCIGFLWHNCNPAVMFMGDTGSLALGGALGVFAVTLRQEILLLLIGGVFVMEAGSVLLQVLSLKIIGRRIFLCSPIHHHFEKKGWTESQIVVRFWILSGLFALLALASLKLR